MRGLPRVSTRSDPIKKLESCGMSDTGGHSELFKAASQLWASEPERCPRPVQLSIEMVDVFGKVREGDADAAVHLLRSSSGAVCTKAMRLKEGFALDIIEQEIANFDVIMVYVDLIDYTIIESESQPNVGQAHSAALFLMRTPNGLSSYYFNPHGCVSRDDHVYELYRTRSRMCRIGLPEAVDTWVVSRFIACLSEQIGQDVRYEPTNTHNYFGPNLQEYDRHGMCYAFPFCLQCAIAWDPTRTLMKNMIRGTGTKAIASEYARVRQAMSAQVGGGSRGIGLLLLRCILLVNRLQSRRRAG